MTPLRWLPRFRRARRELVVLAERERWERADVEAHQLERLNGTWHHAIRHVPHYRDLAADLALPGRFASLAEFRDRVPVLEKSVVQNRPRRLLSERRERGFWGRTSGSTGSPVSVYWGRSAHRASLRSKYRFEAAWGLDIFDRVAFVWGHGDLKHPGLRRRLLNLRLSVEDRLRNRLRIPAYRMCPEDLRLALRRIDSFRPRSIYGYTTVTRDLAREAAAAGFRCRSLALVVLTAEPATPRAVAEVEGAFGVPAIMEYGSIECGFLAGEYPDRTLRVREDRVLLDSVARDDGRHELLVTVLDNPSFPLLRYAIGDATDGPVQRPARGLAVLGKVGGRLNDCVRSRSDELVHPGRIEAVFEELPAGSLRRYRVHQNRDGSLDALVERGTVPIDADEVRLALHDVVGGHTVRVELVGTLPDSASGKHRYVTSDLVHDAGRNGA